MVEIELQKNRIRKYYCSLPTLNETLDYVHFSVFFCPYGISMHEKFYEVCFMFSPFRTLFFFQNETTNWSLFFSRFLGCLFHLLCPFFHNVVLLFGHFVYFSYLPHRHVTDWSQKLKNSNFIQRWHSRLQK